MPRKPRIEIGGGLYHLITRGNNRRKIFRSHDDYLKFTSLLQQQKNKLPFYLYAYCLMPNHFHLLIEMQDDLVSRIMQRVLTGYSQLNSLLVVMSDCYQSLSGEVMYRRSFLASSRIRGLALPSARIHSFPSPPRGKVNHS